MLYKRTIKIKYYMKNGQIIEDFVKLPRRLNKETYNDAMNDIVKSAKAALSSYEPNGHIMIGRIRVRASDISAIDIYK